MRMIYCCDISLRNYSFFYNMKMKSNRQYTKLQNKDWINLILLSADVEIAYNCNDMKTK